ncbi:MAG: cell envelope-related transcriptional attenuator [Streptosporangiaceae bacterium]|nr:cell envelope-related transcriptional attenuator [Streptosporangiaceae bacterium]
MPRASDPFIWKVTHCGDKERFHIIRGKDATTYGIVYVGGMDDSWTDRPTRVKSPGEHSYYGADAHGGGVTRPRGRRRWGRTLLIGLLVLIVLAVAGYFYLDSRLKRENALDYPGRPGDTPGTNWLVVGSDSRAGLSRQQRSDYATGMAAGRRTDSMMLLHTGAGGTTLVSLPRDSYVPIPGHGSNKLNAAFAFGGPKLLVRTVEQVTGVHVDHYAEIGFGGFVGMVDAIGGVDLCVKQPMRDPKAGLNLRPGCQTLSGGQALGFVRTRASARADLDRVKRQREFFGALIKKASGAGVLLNPFRSIPLVLNGTGNFLVDDGDHLLDLGRLMWAMRSVGGGNGTTTTVPIGGVGSSAAAGSYITWDRTRALRLFNAIKEDRAVPTGTAGG